MPLPAKFTWTEDEESLQSTVAIPGAKASQCDFVVAPHYIKVNQAPHFFEADLQGEIDIEDARTSCKLSVGKAHLTLRKKNKFETWGDFRAKETDSFTRHDIRERRRASLQVWEAAQQRRAEERKDAKWKKEKQGEEEQWRLDREARSKVEGWKDEEKKIAEEDVFG